MLTGLTGAPCMRIVGRRLLDADLKLVMELLSEPRFESRSSRGERERESMA